MQRIRAGALAGLFLVFAPALAGGAPRHRNPQQAAAPAAAREAEDASDTILPDKSGPVWSLARILEQAVRQSPTLASARIDVEVADAAVIASTGIEDLLLNISGNYFRQKAQAVASDTLGTDNVDRVEGTATLSKLLPTGGTLALAAQAQRLKSESLFSFGSNQQDQTTTSITVTLNQPLLRGAGETVTRGQESQAGYQAQIARLARETAARTTVRDIVAAYWEVAYAAANLDILRNNLDLARERRRLTAASAKAGATAPTEVLAVDQIIAQREADVVSAELALEQRSIELRRLAGMSIGPHDIVVSVAAPLEVEPRELDLDQVVAQALKASPEIAQLRVQGDNAKLQVEVSHNGLLPRLDLDLFGGPVGVDRNFRDSVGRLGSGDYQVGVGLTFEQPLGRHAAHGAAEQARAERERVTIGMADTRAQIAESAVEAVALARSAQKRMQYSKTAIDLSQKNIKAEIGRFELGKSTNFDVLLRQEEFTQARLSYVRAVVDYLRATAFLQALSGRILDVYGVRLD